MSLVTKLAMLPNGAIFITTVLLLLLAIQRQQTQLFGFILMTERWLNEHNRLLLAAALLRERNRQRRRLRRAPYAWKLPRLNGSWFEIHSIDRAIPETFFRQQLRINRATFDTVMNTLGPRIVRENSRSRACSCPAKILAIGLYRLVHGNSHLTIRPAFNAGKSTVIEAVQDVVGALYELWHDQLSFPRTLRK